MVRSKSFVATPPGATIKEQLTDRGMSQKEFAEKMNTTQQRVSEWECNKVEPSLYNVKKMIEVLKTSFEELTDDIY